MERAVRSSGDAMRILHWIESFHPRIGGAEVFLRHLAAEQVRGGHDCLVLTSALPEAAEADELDGVSIRRLPFHRALLERSLPAIRDIRKRVEEVVSGFAPDIVHLHTCQASAFFFTRLALGPQTRSIYTAHDGHQPDVHAGPSSLLATILRRVDRVVAPSEHVRQALREAYPALATPIERIWSVVPQVVAGSGPPGESAVDVDATGIAPGAVLAIGRLVPEKGFDVFLRALAQACRHRPELRAVIAGDGPHAARLRDLADELGLGARVCFTGWVDPGAVPALIRSASAVVVPSRWQEPFGLVALQAMQAGIPVIAARSGGLTEIVDDGETGLLVPPDDHMALASALVGLLADPSRRAHMGRAGARRAATDFAWPACVRAYDAVYAELAARRS